MRLADSCGLRLVLQAVLAMGCAGGGTEPSGAGGEDSPLLLVPSDLVAEAGATELPDFQDSGGRLPESTVGVELSVPDATEQRTVQPDAAAVDLAAEASEAIAAPEVSVEAECLPDCAGKECGDDGCGGDCGPCLPPEDLCAGVRKCLPETGQCVPDPATAVTCAENPDPCLQDLCNPGTGLCEPGPGPDGLPCDDFDPVTTGDNCLNGVCVGNKPYDFCDEYTDNFDSIKQFPPDHTLVDFEAIEKCTVCACCEANGNYPWSGPDPLGCMKCELESYLAQFGITKVGGMTSTMVFCITGNEEAQMSNKVIFVGGDLMPAPGKYAVQLNLAKGVLAFGLSSVPSASSSDPVVTLRGYDAAGNQVGYDQFSYQGNAPSGCEGTNPVVSFFGFRACGGSQMVKIVAEYTNPNVTIDNLVFFPPLQ